MHRLRILDKNEVTVSKLLTMTKEIHDKAAISPKTYAVALNAIALMAKLVG